MSNYIHGVCRDCWHRKCVCKPAESPPEVPAPDDSAELEAIRACRAAISPTPWFFNSYSAVFSEPLCTEDAGKEACVATVEVLRGDTATQQGARNAEFIAKAPEYVDTLRHMVDELRAKLAEADREIAVVSQKLSVQRTLTEAAEARVKHLEQEVRWRQAQIEGRLR